MLNPEIGIQCLHQVFNPVHGVQRVFGIVVERGCSAMLATKAKMIEVAGEDERAAVGQ